MSTISFAKQALSALKNEKPHTSITDLVDILTSGQYDEEAFDGIPELVESIKLQPTGATEASRAFRKKIKHGTVHQQYRALVLLKASVENGDHHFQTTFADDQLTDAIKHLGTDPGTDPKVKKKLLSVLASWQREFKDEPSMAFVASLYKKIAPHPTVSHQSTLSTANRESQVIAISEREAEYERRRKEEKEAREAREREAREAKEAKRAAKQEEKRKREEEARKKAQAEAPWANKGVPGKKRAPFNFEKEKPQILTAIAETSQAATNLVNALTLLDTSQDTVQENVHVQDCVENAKLCRRRVVRYIQLCENEELIGTLLETNERVIAAFQMYDKLSKPQLTDADLDEVEANLAAANMQNNEVTSGRMREKQRAAVERSSSVRGISRGSVSHADGAGIHPDLINLNFGELGDETRKNLPPPLRPTAARSRGDYDEDEDDAYQRGSLSDFSDYDSEPEADAHRYSTSSHHANNKKGVGRASYEDDSSDEETHLASSSAAGRGVGGARGTRAVGGGAGRRYDNVSDEEYEDTRKGLTSQSEDPFADPFAD